MPSKEESIRELIGNYSTEGFEKVLKTACAPAAFVGLKGGVVLRGKGGAKVRLLGVVKDLPGENGYLAPLLVADVPLETVLTERSSRIRQFKLAREVLEACAERPPMELDGVVAQGIFAFHDREGHFRISLVTAVPENGRFNWSKARRQSFYVTPDPDANATFVQRMGMDWSTLKGIKEAFSVEKLTKEFYDQLFKWYDRACEDERVEYPNGLETDADNREDKNRKHLLRLITRLMFVWFLKQKGLVPEELFDEAALGRILKGFKPTDRRQHQYYRAILQNLFFATLNSEIADRGFADEPKARAKDGKAETKDHGIKTKYRYADAFAISRKEVLDLFRPIPFLNGGLFECLDQEGEDGRVRYYDGFSLQERHRDLGTLTWAHVPNDLFFDPDYGLLPLLKRYNFTVEENSPGDEDVALDPELLGKVFENLLGAYNPETQEIVRKSTGSFYTPREIVNYMVDEALVAHLAGKTGADEATVRALVADGVRPEDGALCKRLAAAIETAKVLDPACGSGAFPMGALLKMTELLRILKKLPEETNLYDLKLQLIENCIFGSDIQEIAVQIAKLRVFISLVCEQKPDWNKPNYGINPLPNLETKYVAADSLIGLKKLPPKTEYQSDLFYETGPVQAAKDALWKVRHLHFLAKTRAEKDELRRRDTELRGQLAAAAKALGYSEESTRLMASWDPYNQNVHAEFFDPEWMFNVKDGFDIVIGNPPFVLINKDEYKKKYAQGFLYQSGKIDLYRLFIELSFRRFAKQPHGIVSYITPNTFLSIPSCKLLRKMLIEQYSLQKIINFSTDVFDSACVNNVVFIATTDSPSDESSISISVDGFSSQQHQIQYQQCRNDGYSIKIFLDQNAETVISKMRQMPAFMTWDAEVSLGVQPYHNSIHSKAQMAARFLHSDHQKTKGYLPELGGRDIPKYGKPKSRGIWLNYSAELYMKPDVRFFSGERIILREIPSTTLIATLTDEKLLVNKSCYIIRLTKNVANYRYLLAVLNSRALGFWIANEGEKSKQHLFPRITMAAIKKLPIPPATPAQQKRIITLVDRILTQKTRDPSADTRRQEEEIDELVYGLYGLTAAERAIVEGRDGEVADEAELEGGVPPGRPVQYPIAPASGGKKKRRVPKIEEEF